MSDPSVPHGSRSGQPKAKLRSLSRTLESSGAAFWCIDGLGRLTYVSPAMKPHLGEHVDEHVGRSCLDAAASIDAHQTASARDPATDSHDAERMLAALLPPDGLSLRGHATKQLHLPGTSNAPIAAHWMWLCSDSDDDSTAASGVMLGCIGDFVSDSELDGESTTGAPSLRERTRIGELLDSRRAMHRGHAQWMLLGESEPVCRLRRQLDIARRLQNHLGMFGKPGSGMRSLAWDTVLGHADTEASPVTILDGSLMDAELLDLYAQPVMGSIFQSNADANSFGGTLIIDRLDEMAHDAQQVLLSWLDRWPERWRLIGLAHQNALSSSDHERDTPSRAGLLPKLHGHMTTMPIAIPSLADRRDDIATLAIARVRIIWQSHERPPQTQTRRGETWTDPPILASDALDALQTYPWPGDLDELDNSLRHAVRQVVGGTLHRKHLPLAIRSFGATAPANFESQSVLLAASPHVEVSLDDSVQAYEQELIDEAIAIANGNKAEAARRLGISRARLLRKLADRDKGESA